MRVSRSRGQRPLFRGCVWICDWQTPLGFLRPAVVESAESDARALDLPSLVLPLPDYSTLLVFRARSDLDRPLRACFLVACDAY